MYKEVAIMWKNKESYVDEGGVYGLSIIKHVTLQKVVAHDFRYDPRICDPQRKMLQVCEKAVFTARYARQKQ